ncbi:hypothetical protein CLOM_g10526 [Closterium sp. NIES-68]|nr:hypothetical protein CLOM_g10526 [Closterium sp. NIES-68]GJP60620.1 hypothetical protein CLOP_g17848 [Closterium sp. NIES-67]
MASAFALPCHVSPSRSPPAVLSQGPAAMPSSPFAAACKRVDHPVLSGLLSVSVPLRLASPHRLLPNRPLDVEPVEFVSHRATVLATNVSSATEFRSGPCGSGSALLQRAPLSHAGETVFLHGAFAHCMLRAPAHLHAHPRNRSGVLVAARQRHASRLASSSAGPRLPCGGPHPPQLAHHSRSARRRAPIAQGKDTEGAGEAVAAEDEKAAPWQQGDSETPAPPPPPLPPSAQQQFQMEAGGQAEGAAAAAVAGEAEGARGVFSVESGKWRVRMAAREEMKAVADLQAEVFHDPPPAPLSALNAFFLEMFKAELFDNLLHKLKYSPPDRHCILAAQHVSQPLPPPNPIDGSPAREALGRKLPASPPAAAAAAAAAASAAWPAVVGVVDLTALDDRSVLKHLSGAREYLYLSGMAVHPTLRRESIASVLLGAVERLSLRWDFEYIVLHVHEDNIAARRLYQKAGYLAIDCDSRWTSTLLGMRRRVLLAKRTNGYLSRAAAAAAAANAAGAQDRAAGVAESNGFGSAAAAAGTSLSCDGAGGVTMHGVAAAAPASASACGCAPAVPGAVSLEHLNWQPTAVCS